MCSRSHIAILLALFAVICIGCRPEGIMSSRQMRKVLIDIHKTEGAIQAAGVRYDAYEERDMYYAQVLEKHGITQAQFDSSIVWYTAHPQFFNKIYPKVLKEIEAEEEAFVTAHQDELSTLAPAVTDMTVVEKVFTRYDLDSVLWVQRNGYPNSWQPLVHDFKDELFPQIGVLR